MWQLLAVLGFLLAGAWLSVVDAREHRLPNRLIAAGLAWVALCLSVAAASSGQWPRLGQALLGSAVMAAWYLLLALVTRGGLGAGDVKFALLVGLITGWFGLAAWIGALWLAFLIGGLAALALRLRRRLGRGQSLAFGPAMFAGAVLALALSQLADWPARLG